MKRYKHVKKQVIDGITFDSGREAERYLELKLLAKAGEISCLHAHDEHCRFPIVIGGVKVLYPNGRQVVYSADFYYFDRKLGYMVVEDVKMKNHRTDTYKLKRAMMLAMGFEISEVT